MSLIFVAFCFHEVENSFRANQVGFELELKI